MLFSQTIDGLLTATLLLLQISPVDSVLHYGHGFEHPWLDSNKHVKRRVHNNVHNNEKRAATTASSASASASASSAAASSAASSSYVNSYQASSTFYESASSSYISASSMYVRPTPTPASCKSGDCKFYSSKTDPYFIAEWPEVNFDTGEFYGGSTPIDESDPSRTLFWIFKPAEGKPVDEITIWLNGGPGCSSLEGFLQENGPIQWQPGTFHPKINPLAWSRLTNMLWVEQPVGTGFTQGKVTATNEYDVADEFVGFFKNWEKLFGIKNYKIYITGESYAGYYIPYISAGMLDQNDTTYFDLSGALMYDPCIGGCGTVQNALPAQLFANANQVILNLNQTTLDNMNSVAATCGMTDYFDKYLVFPPAGNQPTNHQLDNMTYGCEPVYIDYYDNIGAKNPCFDIYHIIQFCPTPSDPLTEYFNRADVKKAIHAPDVRWFDCSGPVFAGNGRDNSPLPISAALPQVIEATNRVLVANGDWDSLVYTNGTLLSIQNMTWNGQLGFQSKPTAEFEVPISINGANPQGVMGIQHYERGLQWVETYQSGHMQPEFQPRAAWRHLQWVLGRIDSLGPATSNASASKKH